MGSTRSRIAIGAVATCALFPAPATAEQRALEHVSVGGNGAFDPEFASASANAGHALFITAEGLDPADDNAATDLYERTDGQTRLVSTGPKSGPSGVQYVDGISADGSSVYFTTDVQLVDADTDAARDVYRRAGGQTTLVSVGPTGGNGAFPVEGGLGPNAISADGAQFVFETNEQLVADDDDTAHDVYLRASGTTALVSTGPVGGDGAFLARFEGASADGSRVLFRTEEALVPEDDNGVSDAYLRAGGQTTLVTGVEHADAGSVASLTPDGTAVLFTSDGQLDDGDTDDSIDLYRYRDGQITLMSTGPAGGNGPHQSTHVMMSADGSHVLFTTEEQLVAADDDGVPDLYMRAGGQTTLISVGPPASADPDLADEPRGVDFGGSRIVFDSSTQLVATDTDSERDTYEWSGGQLTLLSAGPGDAGGEVFTEAVSADATRVVLRTAMRLADADTDSSFDLYEHVGGVTRLLSAGAEDVDVIFAGASADGSHVYFRTTESLLASDTDVHDDLYASRVLAPVNTAPPALSGSPVSGRALACSTGAWANDPTAFAHRWNRDGAPIAGAGAASYTLAGADVGHAITCTVTASNAGGSAAATSAAVTPTAPPPPPSGPLLGACANVQAGAASADRLIGTSFGDRLRGRAGDDLLRGGAGDDCLSGGGGKDRVFGGKGKDRLVGGKGKDRLDGGAGNDRIEARDKRRETVRCGKGRDRVTADRKDRLIGCEKVSRRGSP